jgi:hypothetical protein
LTIDLRSSALITGFTEVQEEAIRSKAMLKAVALAETVAQA